MTQHVPDFERTLTYKRVKTMQGRDVLAVSRCLHRLGYRWADPTMAYGWRMRDNVELFRRRQNMNAIGVYDQPTHDHLAPHFDEYERWLYRNVQAPPDPPAVDRRDKLMHAIWTLYAQRPWPYHAVRPFILYPVGSHVAYPFDCSWLVTQAFYMAGLPDPNGLSYHGGYGNTESLRQHGQQVSTPSPGDLVFYGYYGSANDPAHVAMVVNRLNGIGHGSAGGPRLLPLGYRTIREYRSYV